jgi:hypothetical protein
MQGWLRLEVPLEQGEAPHSSAVDSFNIINIMWINHNHLFSGWFQEA